MQGAGGRGQDPALCARCEDAVLCLYAAVYGPGGIERRDLRCKKARGEAGSSTGGREEDDEDEDEDEDDDE